jgi:hypothetical protein
VSPYIIKSTLKAHSKSQHYESVIEGKRKEDMVSIRIQAVDS